ncbi:MAG: malonyl-ACP O-methyltransferase BioC [Methylococcaceae bacterium]|nr:malonyl-ACP O-methyltransferase BioC [Methylococcaceae bacterium]MDP3904369.1 malonyl-ACP O-methyltransferase BioC [Methylococcaceae bacterium]
MFNPDKVRIRQSFAAASSTYDGAAELQRRVGRALVADLNAEMLTGTVLDLGCGTGFLTGELLALTPQESVIAVDIAFGMLEATRSKLAAHNNVRYICADAEQLPIAASTVDVVVSNLALQWCRNLTAVFAELKRTLKPGGQLVFSTFGPHTLQELKSAWAEVDDYSHVNEFYGAVEIELFLQQAGFKQVRIEAKTYQPKYDSVLALMRELKAIGAQNVIGERNKAITTQSQLQRMIKAYDLYRLDGMIPATFECFLIRAQA